jgi:hypothetical protein
MSEAQWIVIVRAQSPRGGSLKHGVRIGVDHPDFVASSGGDQIKRRVKAVGELDRFPCTYRRWYSFHCLRVKTAESFHFRSE